MSAPCHARGACEGGFKGHLHFAPAKGGGTAPRQARQPPLGLHKRARGRQRQFRRVAAKSDKRHMVARRNRPSASIDLYRALRFGQTGDGGRAGGIDHEDQHPVGAVRGSVLMRMSSGISKSRSAGAIGPGLRGAWPATAQLGVGWRSHQPARPIRVCRGATGWAARARATCAPPQRRYCPPPRAPLSRLAAAPAGLGRKRGKGRVNQQIVGGVAALVARGRAPLRGRSPVALAGTACHPAGRRRGAAHAHAAPVPVPRRFSDHPPRSTPARRATRHGRVPPSAPATARAGCQWQGHARRGSIVPNASGGQGDMGQPRACALAMRAQVPSRQIGAIGPPERVNIQKQRQAVRPGLAAGPRPLRRPPSQRASGSARAAQSKACPSRTDSPGGQRFRPWSGSGTRSRSNSPRHGAARCSAPSVADRSKPPDRASSGMNGCSLRGSKRGNRGQNAVAHRPRAAPTSATAPAGPWGQWPASLAPAPLAPKGRAAGLGGAIRWYRRTGSSGGGCDMRGTPPRIWGQLKRSIMAALRPICRATRAGGPCIIQRVAAQPVAQRQWARRGEYGRAWELGRSFHRQPAHRAARNSVPTLRATRQTPSARQTEATSCSTTLLVLQRGPRRRGRPRIRSRSGGILLAATRR